LGLCGYRFSQRSGEQTILLWACIFNNFSNWDTTKKEQLSTALSMDSKMIVFYKDVPGASRLACGKTL
jgi:hypothetical protein